VKSAFRTDVRAAVRVMEHHLEFFCFPIRLRHSNAAITESKCHTCKNQTVPTFWGAIPRHFVPGYNRTVPPGQKPFAYGKPH
jgi:hypothetical protein